VFETPTKAAPVVVAPIVVTPASPVTNNSTDEEDDEEDFRKDDNPNTKQKRKVDAPAESKKIPRKFSFSQFPNQSPQ
jgi:hypothetical protein